jgi:hypothetical protein
VTGAPQIDPVVGVTLRLSLAALFAAAAWHKWSDRTRFRATLEEYRLLPRPMLGPVASAVPVVEALVSIALVVGSAAGPGPACASGLLVLYTLAIAVNLLRGRRWIDCGCLGSQGGRPLGPGLVARNALLVGASLAATLPPSGRDLVWIDWITIAGSVATVALTWVAAGLLAELRRSRTEAQLPA